MNEDTSRLTKLINEQINLIESLDDNDERRPEEIKTLLGLIDRSCECWKIENQFFENEDRIRSEKEIQKIKNEHENEIKAIESKFKEAELDLKERQLKADRNRTIIEFTKGFISIVTFATFEILAHKRDILDVIDRDQMHVRKNPFKLKLW